MPTIKEAINATGKAWSEIDTEALETRLATFSAAHEELDNALRATRNKIRDVNDRIAALRCDGPNAEAAADAILSGISVLESVPSLQMLEAERERLSAAAMELQRRLSQLKEDLAGFQREIAEQLHSGAEPLIDALEERLQDTLEDLDHLYAISCGLRGWVKSLALPNFVSRMHPMMEASRRIVARPEATLPNEFLDLISGFKSLLEMQTRRPEDGRRDRRLGWRGGDALQLNDKELTLGA